MSFQSDRRIPSLVSVANFCVLGTAAATFTLAFLSADILAFIVEVILPMAVLALALGSGARLILLYVPAQDLLLVFAFLLLPTQTSIAMEILRDSC